MSEIKDHLFGTLATRGHFVTDVQVEEAIAEQQLLEQTGQPVPPLGEVLVQKGYMTSEQVKAVLKGQTNRQAKFGEIAVQWNLCSQASVQTALAFQTERRGQGEKAPRLGEILAKRGIIKPHQVHAILQAQGKVIVRCTHCQTRYNVKNLIPGGKLTCGRCKKVFTATPEEPPADDSNSSELSSHLTQQMPAVTFGDEPSETQTVGPYKVIERLGADHSGVLYKALDPANQKQVVIRVLSEQIMQGADDFERWVAAGQAAAELNHPNLQRILTMSSENNRAYVVMEYVEGQSLRKRLGDGGALPLLETLDIVIQVAEALAYGHGHDLIHGDLHPRHILIGQDKRVRLGNLGTPKKIMHDLRLMAQVSGSLPLYAAPEVLIDEAEADERSDLYSLCALGYHLLTGKPPLEGRDLLQAGFMAASGDIPPADTITPAIPKYVNRLLVKGLNSEPEQRYENADALLADLRKCRAAAMVQAPDVPEVAPGVAKAKPPRRAVRRRRGRPAGKRKGTYILRKESVGRLRRGAGSGVSSGVRGVGSGVQIAVTPTGMVAQTGSVTNMHPVGSGTRPIPRRRIRSAMDSARLQFQDLSPFSKAMLVLVPVFLGVAVTAAIWLTRPSSTREPELVLSERITKPEEKPEFTDEDRRAANEYNVVEDYARQNPSDHAGVVRQIDQFLAKYPTAKGEAVEEAKKLREDFAKAGVQYTLEPHKKKLAQLTTAYQFREAREVLKAWHQLWGDDVAGETATELKTWLESREKELAEELLSKASKQKDSRDWEGARASCQTVADHFSKTYADRALAERAAVDEAAVKSVVNASSEAERRRKQLLAETREAQAPERYLKLLEHLEPIVSRFDVDAATNEIASATSEFANTTTAPKFHALKDDIARVGSLRDRIVEAARQGQLREMKVEYHKELYPLNDAGPAGPILNTANGRVETRWDEFELPTLMEMASRVTDVTSDQEMLDLGLFRLYTGELKDAEITLVKAYKLGAVVQRLKEQLAERVTLNPPSPLPVTEEPKEPVQEEAVVLAFKALGFEITQGIWKISTDRIMSGVPKGVTPQGQPSRLISLRRSMPPFKSLAVDVRGEADTAGFSFGKGKRWMMEPSNDWQRIQLKIDTATGESRFTVDGKPVTSMEPLVEGAVKELPPMVYLRALGKAIEFRNLAIDDPATGGASAVPVPKPVQDKAAAMALKLLGWQIVGGVWKIEGENHFVAVPNEAHMQVGVKRNLADCSAISVDLRGKGESAGFSFGAGKRFIVRPTDEWRRLTLKRNVNGRPKLLINGKPAVSLEDVAEVVSADLTGTFGLRGVGSKIEFRNFRLE